MNVERTSSGPHPLSAGGRLWEKAGDAGEMDDAEAAARIEQGFFREVKEPAKPSKPSKFDE
jgi:hypothetical protein